MTIGIAATGAWAGAGILAGLRAVELIGRGALHGFVSFAALTADQEVLRAETQDGGTDGMFPDGAPARLLRAPYAALISSGPNRPTPLSQFVVAEPGVGLVTGHRFPHVTAQDGSPLNIKILEAMRAGRPAQAAIDDVIFANPSFDAGFIALTTQGGIGHGNMPSVLRRFDQGSATAQCEDTGAKVATLHNAIHPHKAIAPLASEVALDEMRRQVTTMGSITLSAGIVLSAGDAPEIHVDENDRATRVLHPAANDLVEETSFGLGDRVRVVRGGEVLGWLGHEPFMVVRSGFIFSLDGTSELKLPVPMRATGASGR